MLDTSKPLIKVTYENKEYTLGGAGTKFGELVGGTIEQVESSDLQNVSTIKSGAFENSAKLKTAEIPSNVTSIGDNAFSGCSNLTSLTIDEGVETIGANAFNGINSEVSLPSTLTSVGEGAFANNSAITSIDIPASLTVLPANMLAGCNNLTDVNMESTTPPSVTSTTFPQSANINVVYGAYDDYVGNWGDYTDTITRLPAKPSTITVTVTNYLGELVSGASVTISSSSGETYAGTTNESGVFTQGDLQPATYTVSVADLDGFKTPVSQEVTILEDTSNNIEFVYLEKPLTTIYGVRIDLNNSDPETSVEYTDSAVGFNKSYMDFANDTFVYGSWQDKFPFNQIKPCILENGVVVTYLNPNNYEEDIDGNPTNFVTASNQDIMIEIPKIYYRLYKDDNYQYVQISDTQQDGFCCLAHTDKGIEKDKVYVGAYEGVIYQSKVRSFTNAQPSGSYTLGDWRSKANAKGTGYANIYWNLIVLLQCLYIIQFKNLNSQLALGGGWSNNSSYKPANSGRLNTKGMYYGVSGNSEQMKIFGIEGLWGSTSMHVDGASSDGTNLKIADVTQTNLNYGNTGTYSTVYTGIPSSGYITDIIGDNICGFYPKTSGASSTTYYCDYHNITASANRAPRFGGDYQSRSQAGIFMWNFDYGVNDSGAMTSGRLVYHG